MAIAGFLAAIRGQTDRFTDQSAAGNGPRRPVPILRRRLPLLVLAMAFTLLSIGLAAQLAGSGEARMTAFVACTDGICTTRAVYRDLHLDVDEIAARVNWSLVAVGALSTLAVFGVWGLAALCAWTPGQLTVLCLATLPIHFMLLRFAVRVYRPVLTVEVDLIMSTPSKPLALVFVGLLVLQGVLQLYYVIAQSRPWLQARFRHARAKSPA